MSLFSKIGRAIGKVGGKVLKAGLSVATRGVSDKVLNALKAVGAQKKANATLTRAAEAMALRHAPQTKSTTNYARDLLRGATRSAGQVGDSRSRTSIDAGNALPGSGRTTRARAPRRARRARAVRPQIAAPVLKAARPKARRKKAAGGARRTAPASFAVHAQRAKALAAEWRAAGGKEGTGQGFFDWKRGK